MAATFYERENCGALRKSVFIITSRAQRKIRATEEE